MGKPPKKSAALVSKGIGAMLSFNKNTVFAPTVGVQAAPPKYSVDFVKDEDKFMVDQIFQASFGDVATGTVVLTNTETKVWTFGPPGTPRVTAADIGAADANRRVLCGFTCVGDYGTDPSNFTIGGVAATLVDTTHGAGAALGSFDGFVSWFYADVPTGTTADISWDDGPPDGAGPANLAIYTFDKSLLLNASPVVNTVNVTSGTTNTGEVNTEEGGFVILCAIWDFFDDAASFGESSSTTPLSDDYESNPGGSATRKTYFGSVKQDTPAATPFQSTFTWTNSSQCLMSMISWV